MAINGTGQYDEAGLYDYKRVKKKKVEANQATVIAHALKENQ